MIVEEEEGYGDWIVGLVSDAGNFVADNLAETRDAILDTGAEIADGIGDDAVRGGVGVAIVTPASIALGGLLVAVALNPSLLTNATKSVKKLF